MPLSPSGSPVLGAYTLTPELARRYLEANALPPYGDDEDSKQLERYEAHWTGEQYSHQETDWWGLSADQYETISPKVGDMRGFNTPTMGMTLTTRQKRPSIETGACAAIVEGYTDLMYSEQAAPQLTVQGDEESEAMLNALFERMAWTAKWAFARSSGGAVGAVVAMFAARDGRIDMEVHNRRCVIPLWRNRRALQLAAVLIWRKYTAIVEVEDPKTGHKVTKEVECVHRRIVTEAEDVVYEPIRMDDPRTWGWKPVQALSAAAEFGTAHNLGFFPGVWVQNTAADDSPDGRPDCDGAWKQIDALDRMLSQTNKGELAVVDPSLVIADDPKAKEAGVVRTGSDNTIELSEKGTAKLLEPTATGLSSAMEFSGKLEQWISRRTGYVFVDPKEVGAAAASSLAIKLMFRPMIQRADRLRQQYGRGMRDAAKVVLRLVAKFSGEVPLPAAPDGTPRVGVFAWDLEPRIGPGGVPLPYKLGPGGPIEVKWGPYFNSSPAEDEAKVRVAASAKTAGLVDQRTAAASVANEVFQVRDVDAMLEKANKEQAAETDRLLEQQGGFGGGGGFLPLPSDRARGQAGSDAAHVRREGRDGQPAGDGDAS